MNSILVTGGAGYIGSHVALTLRDAGHHVVVVDDLSTGLKAAVLDAELVECDVGDRVRIARVLREHSIDTVMHLAASTVVPESVTNPLKYYSNNVCAMRALLECCVEQGVDRFVFSSTAAVYGHLPEGRADEESPTVPINPYGTTKLIGEWMLRDIARTSPLRYLALRYFNVAGCDPQGRVGQSTSDATLLVKVACEAAVGKRHHVPIFGTDYPTPDGTGVRDYIHVTDLAAAHLKAVEYLNDGGESRVLNVGYGHGYSVREVLRVVQEVSGTRLDIVEQPRRPGDPPILVAQSNRIRPVLNWQPHHAGLQEIVASTLDWERRNGRARPCSPNGTPVSKVSGALTVQSAK